MQPRSVLVVDDDEIRKMMTILLEMDGHVVTAVARWYDAITSLAGMAKHPQLELLDLELGDMAVKGW